MLGLAALVVGEALVQSSLADDPSRAHRIWPNHPDALFADRVSAFYRAATLGRAATVAEVAQVVDAIRVAPLSPEPFLVRGAALREAGDHRAATAVFTAAVQREPRSIPGHYFLAENYDRTGRPAMALAELGRLIRLLPGASGLLAPRIAAALRTPGAMSALASLVADNPALRDDVLQALATDAGNIDLIATMVPIGSRGPWLPGLVQSLIKAGEYDRAYTLWAGHAGPRPLLNDPRFALTASPPFGWTLASGSAGTAEPDRKGGLHLVYFGRDPLVGASQLVVLPPGRYRFTYTLVARSPQLETVSWLLTCVPTEARVVEVGLVGAAPDVPVHIDFSIADGCPAQRLDLVATPTNGAAVTDVTLSGLSLRRIS